MITCLFGHVKITKYLDYNTFFWKFKFWGVFALLLQERVDCELKYMDVICTFLVHYPKRNSRGKRLSHSV